MTGVTLYSLRYVLQLSLVVLKKWSFFSSLHYTHTHFNQIFAPLTLSPYFRLILFNSFLRFRSRLSSSGSAPFSSLPRPLFPGPFLHCSSHTGSHQSHVSQPVWMWRERVVDPSVSVSPCSRGCGLLGSLAWRH